MLRRFEYVPSVICKTDVEIFGLSGVQRNGACFGCFPKHRVVRQDQVPVSGNPRKINLAAQSVVVEVQSITVL
jgi:hypothetical protein